MADTYVAKANVVKVAVGPADGNRVARIIRKGGAIPEGVEQTSLDALVKRGLIEKVKPDAKQSAAAKAKAEADAAAAAQAAADKAAADALVAAAKTPAK